MKPMIPGVGFLDRDRMKPMYFSKLIDGSYEADENINRIDPMEGDFIRNNKGYWFRYADATRFALANWIPIGERALPKEVRTLTLLLN